MRRALPLVLAWLLLGCGPESEPEPIVSDPLDPSTGGDQGDVVLPALRRLGRIAAGTYLFSARALGEDAGGLRQAELIEVGPDSFTISVDGGPHRELSRREVWPMACLRAPVDFEEAALRVHLDEGAPVYVLASSSGGARVSVAMHMEHSEVVHPTAITTDECPIPAPAEADGRVAEVAEGDAACLFPDMETFDEAVGLPVPAGAPATLRRRDGEWAETRVMLRGGWAQGWASGEVIEPEATAGDPAWDAAAIGGGRCLFPGRSEREANVDPVPLEEDPAARPMIPPENIERVFARGTPQIRTCYDTRLNEVPDLAVDLEVVILVDPDGRVDRVQITRGAGADEPFDRCVREVIGRWRFYPPRVGAVTLRRSWDLRPPEEPEAPEGAED